MSKGRLSQLLQPVRDVKLSGETASHYGHLEFQWSYEEGPKST